MIKTKFFYLIFILTDKYLNYFGFNSDNFEGGVI